METTKRVLSTKRMVIIGMMMGITIILCYTPIGVIPLQPVSATITHIPTIIVAILEGPVVGAILGLAFGLITLVKAATSPAGVLDPYFINPLISVLPRILIGITTYYAYKAANSKLNNCFSIILGAAVGSMTNTLGAMGMLYVLYASDLTNAMGSSAGAIVIGIITTYGIMEMVAAVIITVAVVTALKKTRLS